jgi:hexosaminidase
MKKIILLFLITISLSTIAQTNISIIPKPAEVTSTGGYLTIKEPIGFIKNVEIKKDPSFLFKRFLKTNFGFTKLIEGDTHSYGLATEIFLDYEKNYSPSEGYEIEITNKGIKIKGTEKGIFYAFQTLEQLFPLEKTEEIKIPYSKIKDYPRFQYRGMHLDVGRHFFGVDEVKKYIDYLAFHKFNTFHWHLTEDQGWRIEIKKYPLLTSVGGFRNGTVIGRYPGSGNDSIPYGGFYTQEEVKEIVAYALDRYITIIPEIEMPGHSSAAIAAYPKLSCFPDESTKIKASTPWAGSRSGKQVQQTWGVFEDVYCPSDYTFKFLEDVLDEVMPLFPSKYIHIGGDECPKDAWKRSEFCQKLIREKNLKDEHGLQSYFISSIEKYLNSKGRNIIGWDEILEGGLAPNATVMSWRGEQGGIAAAQQHHNVIMTPGKYVYFDHTQTKNEDSVTIGGFVPWDTVYNYEPVPKELNAEEAKYVLGAQANVWTEYIGNNSKLEYMIFPRMSALSEVLWSPKELRNTVDFKSRLTDMVKRYKMWGANYFTGY